MHVPDVKILQTLPMRTRCGVFFSLDNRKLDSKNTNKSTVPSLLYGCMDIPQSTFTLPKPSLNHLVYA